MSITAWDAANRAWLYWFTCACCILCVELLNGHALIQWDSSSLDLGLVKTMNIDVAMLFGGARVS